LVWASKPNKLQFVVAPQNRREDEDDAGHVLRSSGLLHVEASRARVSQSGLKTGGGATADEPFVAPSRRSCVDQIDDGWVDAMGCVGPYYPYFTIFIILYPSGIVVLLVFCLRL
jgi:hypothetical protein